MGADKPRVNTWLLGIHKRDQRHRFPSLHHQPSLGLSITLLSRSRVKHPQKKKVESTDPSPAFFALGHRGLQLRNARCSLLHRTCVPDQVTE
ncbi:hypothetical protein BRADI_4g34204v3 [Brachypodium distachyon]|uniref:Uncharacterized protein n=1 Tax=Brachypodium distachyon TaxID=15368 RepID=A0A2K2CS68_BRADI|nr:hypothetical protein BRADI_4g34204v3 [Brachypodium distachyon]